MYTDKDGMQGLTVVVDTDADGMDTRDPRNKPKRTRKPWVYKSQYIKLQKKYNILKWITIAGWLAFALAIKLA